MWRSLRGEQRRPDRRAARRTRRHLVGQVPADRVEHGRGGVRRGPQPGQQGGDVRVVRRRGLGGRDGLAPEVRDAADAPPGDLGVEPRDRPVRDAPDDAARLVDHRRDALEPGRDRREPDRQRRELAGEQGVEAAAEQVHPQERIPRLLAELGLGEPERVELAEEEVAIDRVVARQGRVLEPGQAGGPAVDEGEPLEPAGLADVGPSVVEPVVADGRGDVRLEHEQLLEERGDEVVERGHGHRLQLAGFGASGSRWRLASLARPIPTSPIASAAMAGTLAIVNGRVFGGARGDGRARRGGADRRASAAATSRQARTRSSTPGAASSGPGSTTPISTCSRGRASRTRRSCIPSRPRRRSSRRSGRTRPPTRARPGSSDAAGCTPRSPAASRPASCSTPPSRTGRPGWAATTATPAGRTAPRSASPASIAGRPIRPAGLIVRDADGEPTGVLKEDAQALVDRLLPARSADDDLAAVRRAFDGAPPERDHRRAGRLGEPRRAGVLAPGSGRGAPRPPAAGRPADGPRPGAPGVARSAGRVRHEGSGPAWRRVARRRHPQGLRGRRRRGADGGDARALRGRHVDRAAELGPGDPDRAS